MTLRSDLAAWDGRTTDALRAIVSTHPDPDALSDLCADPDVAVAASWVIKACLEDGQRMTVPLDLLKGSPDWATALHLLQSVRYVPIKAAPGLVTPYLTHPKPMVRAWALDAYLRLGGDRQQVQIALQDSAASVRARARKWQ